MRRPTSRTRMSSSASPGATGSAMCSAGGGAALPSRDKPRPHERRGDPLILLLHPEREPQHAVLVDDEQPVLPARLAHAAVGQRAQSTRGIARRGRSATRPMRTALSDRPSAESPGDTSTRRAAEDAIRSPSSRSMAARGSSLRPPSTSASTTGPDTIRSSRPTALAGVSRIQAKRVNRGIKLRPRRRAHRHPRQTTRPAPASRRSGSALRPGSASCGPARTTPASRPVPAPRWPPARRPRAAAPPPAPGSRPRGPGPGHRGRRAPARSGRAPRAAPARACWRMRSPSLRALFTIFSAWALASSM